MRIIRVEFDNHNDPTGAGKWQFMLHNGNVDQLKKHVAAAWISVHNCLDLLIVEEFPLNELRGILYGAKHVYPPNPQPEVKEEYYIPLKYRPIGRVIVFPVQPAA
jgi:hypothetical protein